MYFKGSQTECFNLCISVTEGCFNFGTSADSDEMQHYAAFHLGLHCLPKYPFRSFQYVNG